MSMVSACCIAGLGSFPSGVKAITSLVGGW